MSKQQASRRQSKRRRPQAQRNLQASRQSEERLWSEAEVLARGYDLDDEESWREFAAQVMYNAGTLYDESEFEGLLFYPADALHVLLAMFKLYVPPPDALERLPLEEQKDASSEAFMSAVLEFVTPGLQKDLLGRLGRCRRRLKREKNKDGLALAAAVEWLLRSDERPEIWATCGILHRVLQRSLEEAYALEDAKAKAFELAQAVQPELEDVDDLEEGSPAYEAFWEAIEARPELAEYVERQYDLDLAAWQALDWIDAELGEMVLEPEELDHFLATLVSQAKQAHPGAADVQSFEQFESQLGPYLFELLPDVVRTSFPPERIQALVQDMAQIVEDGQASDPLVQRAHDLWLEFSDQAVPYWDNVAFVEFLFNVAATWLGLADNEDES